MPLETMPLETTSPETTPLDQGRRPPAAGHSTPGRPADERLDPQASRLQAALPDALVRAILEDLLDPEGRGLDPEHLAGAVRDMKARVARMPRYMGAGMVALTLLFGAGGYPLWPRRRRLLLVEGWRRAPLAFFRDFVEFYEKMGTFVYYTHVEHAHSEQTPMAHAPAEHAPAEHTPVKEGQP